MSRRRGKAKKLQSSCMKCLKSSHASPFHESSYCNHVVIANNTKGEIKNGPWIFTSIKSQT